MKVALKDAEILNVSRTNNGQVVEVLHQNGAGKEVLKIYYASVNKKTGAAIAVPEFKQGGKYTGTVNFNGLCFPVQ